MAEKKKGIKDIRSMASACLQKIKEGEIPSLMGRLGRETDVEVYMLKTFQVEVGHRVMESFIGFWRKKQKEKKSVTILVDEDHLRIERSGASTVLQNVEGLRLEEKSKDSDFPKTLFIWSGEEAEGVPKGTLVAAEFDFGGSNFVRYNYKGGMYEIINRQNLNLAEWRLPEDLNTVSTILGISFEKQIDFDAKADELYKKSGLAELYKEICEAAP